MVLVKASFKNLVTGERIPCMFNPPSYEFTKDNVWADQPSKGTNTPSLLEFNGGKSADLNIDLFFDTHITGEDVRTKYTNKIWNLALVDSSNKDPKTGKSAPPEVEFRWGQSWSFKAVVVSVSQNFTLFLEDGTPTRADVKLKLRQVQDENQYPGQNPTSRGAAGQRIHVVQQRETLDLIAAKEYGESSHWRHIARANNISDPLRIKPGMTLSLPPLDE
jgi:hypothetical protein